MSKDPHQVLQVTAAAESEVIRAAYRALALKYHPDRDASGYAAQRMAEINEATRGSAGTSGERPGTSGARSAPGPPRSRAAPSCPLRRARQRRARA